MAITSVITWAIIIEFGVLLASITILVAHAGWLKWRQHHYTPILKRARGELQSLLFAQAPANHPTDSLEKLPLGDRIALIAEVARSLAGAERERLRSVAARTGLVDWAESNANSRVWWRRLRGARLITLLGSDSAVMSGLLWDKNEFVRSQAAEWVPDHPNSGLVARLLVLLNDEHKLCRFTAQNSLLRLGDFATPALVEYLSAHTGRRVVGALEVAAHLSDSRLLDPALSLCADTTPLVRARAAALLGALGGHGAVGRLNDLTKDPEHSVREASARALGHLSQWRSAPQMTVLLGDTSWNVRRAAALALTSLGSPGLVALNLAARNTDTNVSTIARRVLASLSAEDNMPLGVRDDSADHI